MLVRAVVFVSSIFTVNGLPTEHGKQSITTCGQPLLRRRSKVVGGDATIRGEFPWTVSIRLGGKHHCGGVIINSRWILTAAHCLKRGSPSDFTVRVGEFNIFQRDSHSRDYSLERIVLHDSYRGASRVGSTNHSDIGLMKTAETIDFNEYASPICIPHSDRGEKFAGEDGVVVGWGKL